VSQYFGVQERYPGNTWFNEEEDWLLRAYCQVFGWYLLFITILMITN